MRTASWRSVAVALVVAVLVVLASNGGVARPFFAGVAGTGDLLARTAWGALVASGALVLFRYSRPGAAAVEGPLAGGLFRLVIAATLLVGATAGAATAAIRPRLPRAPGTIEPPSAGNPPQNDPDPVRLDYSPTPWWFRPLATALFVVCALLTIYAIGRWFVARSRRRRPIATEVVVGVTQETDEARTMADLLDESAAKVDEGDDPRTAIIAAYAHLLERIEAAGIPRLSHEAPLEHLQRSMRRLRLPSEPFEAVTDQFLVARFSTHQLTEADRDAVRAAFRSAARFLLTPPVPV